MTKSVVGIGRMLRIIIGLGLIAAAAAGMIGAWGHIAIVPHATGLVGWCPPYSLLGINTCRK